jgi:hypothetical protein
LLSPDRKHYGEEVRLELIDGSTNAVIGTTLLTAHSLILDQKDEIVSRKGYSLFQALRGPVIWKGKRTIKLLLRNEGKNAPSSDGMLTRKRGDDKHKENVGSGKSDGILKKTLGGDALISFLSLT